MADCNIEKTVDKASDKIPYTYSLSMGELLQLYSESQKDIFIALIKAYDFGFIRGTRAMAKERVSIL